MLVAAGAGLGLSRPFAVLVAHSGIDVLLVVLVFFTAVTIDPAALRALPALWRTLLIAVVAGVTVLPALSWLAAQLVTAGPLRDGVVVAGLAPCEIASVATTAMAGGAAAMSAGILIGSSVATVVVAGPILALEAPRSSVHPGHIVVNLALVVGLPLVAGLVLRRVRPLPVQAERAASLVATGAVVALVALVASQVHLGVRYLAVVAALVVFLGATAAVGWLLGRRTAGPVATAVVLTISMRDFAIAAGLAAAAFGSAAAAPLGVYGVIVLVWGTAVAAALRARTDR